MESDRLSKIPPYLFAELDKKKRELIAKGADLIDLTIGDPDLPTPEHIVQALCDGVKDPKFHRYPPYSGIAEFRNAAAEYLFKTRKVGLDPETEILTLIGSKEGIAHIPFAFLNKGDVALVPSPGYPVYGASTILADATPFEMPLKSENNFLPDLDAIPADVVKKARLIFLNYPNNPTSAIATMEFFERAVLFAKKNNILICHDAAYLEVAYDGYKAPSILEVKGAKDVAIEFHSLSKTFNMTGWRLGFAAGDKKALALLGKIKSNIDSSATAFVQYAGAVALRSDLGCVKKSCDILAKRRDILVDGLKRAGWDVKKPAATYYIWTKLPRGLSIETLLQKVHIAVTPGEGFGRYGKDFIRFSLTTPTERIEEAVKRIATL
jgi:LL-diaminopimelate aminotransferase